MVIYFFPSFLKNNLIIIHSLWCVERKLGSNVTTLKQKLLIFLKKFCVRNLKNKLILEIPTTKAMFILHLLGSNKKNIHEMILLVYGNI